MAVIAWKKAVSSSFNVAANWDPAQVPGSGDFVDIEIPGTYTVTSAQSNSIGDLYLQVNATLAITKGTFSIADTVTGSDNYGTIAVASGAALAIGTTAGTVFYNEGTIKLNGTTGAASFRLVGPYLGLTGGGKLTLSNSTTNAIVSNGQDTDFTNINNLISGAGRIGDAHMEIDNAIGGTITSNGSAALTLTFGAKELDNSGTISTTGTGGMVIGDLTTNSGGYFYNDGSLLATGTGALTIANVTVQGDGVVKVSASGAHLDLKNAVFDYGGIIQTVAGATINALAGTVDTIGAARLVNAGTVAVANGATLTLQANAVNTGEIDVNGSSAATKLQIGSFNTRLSGGGSLVLTNNAKNAILSTGATATLNNRDNTISGAGTIGDANLRFVNEVGGKVIANGSVGMTLVGASNAAQKTTTNAGLIQTTGAGGLTIKGTINNTGTIAALGSSGLTLNAATLNNGNGLVSASGAGSTITLLNSAILYGSLFTVAAGANGAASAIKVLAGTSTIDSALSNAGSVTVAAGATLIMGDQTNNTGTFSVGSTAKATTIEIAADGWTLDGGGKLILSDFAGNQIVSSGAAARIKNLNNTISGSGTIGDSSLSLSNGTGAVINANGTAGMTIDTGGNKIYNSGLIESTGTGGLLIESALGNNGTLLASAGNLHLAGDVNGLGKTVISGSGQVEFGGAARQMVVFDTGASGTLRFDSSASASFNATVSGFTTTDTLDFSYIGFSGQTSATFYATPSHGALNVTDGTTTASLTMVGNAPDATFKVASDGHGGTLVTLAA